MLFDLQSRSRRTAVKIIYLGLAIAMEIVTQAQPSASSYGTFAQYAYLAGQERKGDLAAARAIQLAVPAQRRLLRTQLAAIKTQAKLQAGRGTTGSGSAAPQTKR